ncbi:Hypothetical predicted protein, partial [Paramuricea clavata]
EHWLHSDSLSLLETVDCSFSSWGRCSSEGNDDSISRREKGGISFLWRKEMNICIDPMNELDRILVLRVKLLDDTYVYIIGVYLPTTSEPADTFNYRLKLLEDESLGLCNNGSIIILGDLNAHIGQLAGERSFTKINSRGRCVHRIVDNLNLFLLTRRACVKDPLKHFMGARDLLGQLEITYLFQENLVPLSLNVLL